MNSRILDPLESNLAVFLDVDGTLLHLAATPDAVVVSEQLRATLELASRRVDGALALVSGRSIKDLDSLFAPLAFPVAGQHGLERRDMSGKILSPPMDPGLLDSARRSLKDLQLSHEGLILEDKGTALAMHYRLAPDAETRVKETMMKLCSEENRFVLRPGKCVLELTPRGATKGTAIEAFMREPPFHGRVPVFIGDDVTDEDGFAAVNALGGYSARVGASSSTAAHYRLEDVAAVLDWLGKCNP